MTIPASQPTTSRKLGAESRKRLAVLKADIERGLADIKAGRVRDFDAGRIIERGRRLLAERLPSG